MADKERTYNIPLRKEWLKVPGYKRTPKAIRALREFIQKHMKSDNVKIGKFLNKEIWKNGNRNPPHKVSVVARHMEEKDEKFVHVELVGAPVEEKKPKEKKKKGILSKMKGEDKAEEKKAEEKPKEVKEEKKAEEKPKDKPEKKEAKKSSKK